MKRVFKVSRLLHKYIGLLLLVVLMIMSATGILLNHPTFFAGWNLPQGFLGDSYRYENWNRFSYRDGLVLEDGSIIIGGKLGVFYGKPAEGALKALNKGLPGSLFYRDTFSLLAVKEEGGGRLYAGTRGGLYSLIQGDSSWKKVATPSGKEHIVDLVSTNGKILAFTPFSCLVLDKTKQRPVFTEMLVPFPEAGQRIPGYHFLFALHSGKLFGTLGKLVIDTVGAVLIFLCLTSFYIWFFPKGRRRLPSRKGKKVYAFSFRNHLKIGVWFALPLLVLAVSGAFIRPPLIILANSWQVPLHWMGHEAHEIQKAEMIGNDRLIVATRNGWYRGTIDLTTPFEQFTPPFPVFGMGTTVLAKLTDHTLLAGSFSGLYYWNLDYDITLDLQGAPVSQTESMRPGEIMAAGALIQNETLIGYADYREGMQDNKSTPLSVQNLWPKEFSTGEISLYHFLFEIHNGRFLRDFIGKWYILFIPLTGIFLITVIVTGVFDWLWRKK